MKDVMSAKNQTITISLRFRRATQRRKRQTTPLTVGHVKYSLHGVENIFPNEGCTPVYNALAAPIKPLGTRKDRFQIRRRPRSVCGGDHRASAQRGHRTHPHRGL